MSHQDGQSCSALCRHMRTSSVFLPHNAPILFGYADEEMLLQKLTTLRDD